MGVPTWRRLRPGRPLMCTSAVSWPRRWIASLESCGCSGCRVAAMRWWSSRGLPGSVRATYEAGPGFVLARKLEAIGVDCLVCAPGLIPRGPSDRVKTDRRDAERLVRLLAAGELHRGGGPERRGGGAARSRARAGGPARRLMRARHRLAKLLLRHEVRFDGPQANWTQAHLGWLATVQLASRRRSGRWRTIAVRSRPDDPPRTTRG